MDLIGSPDWRAGWLRRGVPGAFASVDVRQPGMNGVGCSVRADRLHNAALRFSCQNARGCRLGVALCVRHLRLCLAEGGYGRHTEGSEQQQHGGNGLFRRTGIKRRRYPAARSGLGGNPPDVKVFFVARSGYVNAALARGPVERRADVFLGVRQCGKRHAQCRTRSQLIDVAEQLRDDFLVLSIPALWNIELQNGFELHGRRGRF